jgi:hypothetical protein
MTGWMKLLLMPKFKKLILKKCIIENNNTNCTTKEINKDNIEEVFDYSLKR